MLGPNIETLNYKIDATREQLTAISGQLAALDSKLDGFADLTTRHDEQIKLIQRGGGSALTLVVALVGALIRDKLHL